MKTYVVILLILTLSIANINAQNISSKPCNEPEYQQFDFWIGNWNVYDTTGKLVGVNSIAKLLDGCVIQENWQSETSPYKGSSYNYYNKSDMSWNQVWIDNQGEILELKGSFENNKIVLKSEMLEGKKTQLYYNQISWELKKDGTVTQIWEIFDAENKIIQTLFHGNYKKQ